MLYLFIVSVSKPCVSDKTPFIWLSLIKLTKAIEKRAILIKSDFAFTFVQRVQIQYCSTNVFFNNSIISIKWYFWLSPIRSSSLSFRILCILSWKKRPIEAHPSTTYHCYGNLFCSKQSCCCFLLCHLTPLMWIKMLKT